MSDNVSDKTSSELMQAFLQFNQLYRCVGSERHERRNKVIKFSEAILLFYITLSEKEKPEGVSASELSVIMNVKPPTINPLLANLEKIGFISRKTDAHDRRFVRFTLTDAGKEFIKEHQNTMFQKIHGLANYLGEEKSKTLVRLMNDVFRYFSKTRTVQEK